MKKPFYILFIFFFCSIFSLQAQQWVQKGNTIAGIKTLDRLGWSICMSDDATTIAFVALGGDDGYSTINIYQWNGLAWIPKGAPLKRKGISILSSPISLSADGNNLAIGSPWPNGSYDPGSIEVCRWDGSTWVQKGEIIRGKREFTLLGFSITLSADGNTVATGGVNHVEVYQWQGSSWVAKGEIRGDRSDDHTGYAIDLSNNGNVIIVSATRRRTDEGDNSGVVKILDWKDTAWVQRGNSITGKKWEEQEGQCVRISADGNIVATASVRALENVGRVRIYEWKDTAWIQKGKTILGTKSREEAGASICLSKDGNAIAIGSPNYHKNEKHTGCARLYEWNDTAWVQKGISIEGEMDKERAGSSVWINNDATIFAVGSPFNSVNGTSSGCLKVYEYTDVISPKVNDSISLHILFERNSAQITKDSEGEMLKLLGFMKQNPTVIIELAGHTEKDETGSSEAERKAKLDLSLERVQKIKDYLVGQDISAKRIKIKAYGGTHPISDDPNKNRRVVMKILKI